MAEAKVSLKPEKFNGQNWVFWREKVLSIFMLDDVIGIVDGTEKKPDPVRATSAGSTTIMNADAITKWTKKNNKALATIKLSLEDSVLILVLGCDTAYEAWQNLLDRYEQVTMQNVILCERRYRECKMEEGTSVQEHINKHKLLVRELAAIGQKVDDDRQVMELVLSLPPSYDALVNSLQLVQEGLTMKLLESQLLLEEQKRTERKNEDATVAMYSAKVGGRGPKKPGGANYKGNKRVETRECFKCKKQGHIARDCPDQKKGKPARASAVVGLMAGISSFLDGKWILDSGATHHMCCSENDFDALNTHSELRPITLPDGGEADGKGVGSVFWSSDVGEVEFRDNMYVPEFKQNLVSVHRITQSGGKVVFINKGAEIIVNDQVVATASLQRNGLYVLDGAVSVSASSANVSVSYDDWHRRLGHLNVKSLTAMKDMVNGMDVQGKPELQFCEPCQHGKQTRDKFPEEATLTESVLELVHSDLCGPMELESLSGKRYILTFTDDHSRYSAVYFLAQKSEAFAYFKQYHVEVERSTGEKLRCLRTDNGSEYVNRKFKSYLQDNGIRHQMTVPYTPQQNGVSERLNRTLLDSARSMLHQAGMPKRFWAEAVYNANYVRNRSPTKRLKNVVPFEVFWKKKPSIQHLRTFGCDAFAQTPKPKRKKLDSRSQKLIFLGYDLSSKGYRLWDSENEKVLISRDVKFHEASFSFGQETTSVKSSQPENPISLDNEITGGELAGEKPSDDQIGNGTGNKPQEYVDSVEEPNQPDSNENEAEPEVVEMTGQETPEPIANADVHPPPGRPVRNRQQPAWMRDGNYHFDTDDDLGGDSRDDGDFALSAGETDAVGDGEPKSVAEALNGPDAESWKKAMEEEYESIVKNEVFELVEIPHGRKPVDCKWVFKLKRDSDGNPVRYKARLVAKGFSQQPGVDFDETFSPVSRYSSVRTVLAISNALDLELHQMDVKAAFLNGNLDEEIYI